MPSEKSDAGTGLVTARLQLRRFEPADLGWLDRLNSDAEVMKFLGGPSSLADTQAMLDERILAYYEQHPGLGVWVTLGRASGEPIGFHLLNHIRGETHVQVGYRLLKPYWGQGYATEMSIALLRYGFRDLVLPQIVAITELGNAASQRVLLKCGLMRGSDRVLAHPSYASWGLLAWFERDAADWLAEHRRSESRGLGFS